MNALSPDNGVEPRHAIQLGSTLPPHTPVSPRRATPGQPHMQDVIVYYLRARTPCQLTSIIPATTSAAPNTNQISIGSFSNTTPNVTPNSGVMKENTDTRDAR